MSARAAGAGYLRPMPAPREAPLSGANLEMKARVADPDALRARVAGSGAVAAGTERQVDRYFRVARGRLKLRRSSADGAHLIAYHRPENGPVREARFHRLPVADPDGLEATLVEMLGAGALVGKTREVWWWEDVRIHLDDVDGIGPFLEFEARVDRIGSPEEARARLDRLAGMLGVAPADVVGGAYGEMA